MEDTTGAYDRIRITGITATGNHGVLEHERQDGQTFVADVALHVDTRPAAEGDRLDLTVDYGLLAEDVAAVLAGPPVDLIETLAERIAAVALERNRVLGVDVVVHKPQAPLTVPFADVTVEIHRSRRHSPSVARRVARHADAEPVAAPPAVRPLPAVVPEAQPAAEPAPEPQSVAEPVITGAPIAAPVAVAGALATPVAEAPVPAAPVPPVEPEPIIAVAPATPVVPAAVPEPPAGPLFPPVFGREPEPTPEPAFDTEPGPAYDAEPEPAYEPEHAFAPEPAPGSASAPEPEPEPVAMPPAAESVVAPLLGASPAAAPPFVPPAVMAPTPLTPADLVAPPGYLAPEPAPGPAVAAETEPEDRPEPATAPVPELEPEPTFDDESPAESTAVLAPGAFDDDADDDLDDVEATDAPVPPAPPVEDAAPADRMDVVPDGPVDAVVALGSNLGPSQDILHDAIAALAATPGVELRVVAPMARTAPVGGPEQQDFLNTLVIVSTTLSPRALLHVCQAIEHEFGRERTEHWGPRTLDIDIVTHGSTVGVTDDLELPHPRAHERAFVLVPWAHVDPDAVLPGLGGGPVAVLAETSPDRDGIRWMALDWWGSEARP